MKNVEWKTTVVEWKVTNKVAWKQLSNSERKATEARWKAVHKEATLAKDPVVCKKIAERKATEANEKLSIKKLLIKTAS